MTTVLHTETELGRGVGADGVSLEGDLERVEKATEVRTVLHTEIGICSEDPEADVELSVQQRIGSVIDDTPELVSGADVDGVGFEWDSELVKPELGCGVGADGVGLEADSERAETTMAVSTVLHTETGICSEGPEVGVELGFQKRFGSVIAANQTACSRVVAARAARLAQWRLETDELVTMQAAKAPSVQYVASSAMAVAAEQVVHSWTGRMSGGTVAPISAVKVRRSDAAPLTSDRDLMRPGWQDDEDEPGPPRPSRAEAAKGR